VADVLAIPEELKPYGLMHGTGAEVVVKVKEGEYPLLTPLQIELTWN
jgi:hypothetical protein